MYFLENLINYCIPILYTYAFKVSCNNSAFLAKNHTVCLEYIFTRYSVITIVLLNCVIGLSQCLMLFIANLDLR
jgi:hypothetical protein